MSTPKGYSSQEKEDRLSAQFQTVEPIRELQFGSSVLAHQYVYEVATDAVEAGTTAAVLVATGHAALKGDVIRLTSGTLVGYEAKVWSVTANSITLAETLPTAPAVAVSFQILRHKYPTVDATGATITTAIEVATAANGGAIPALLKVAGGYSGTSVTPLKTDASGELQVDVLTSALPSGAATEAKQDSAITILGTIDGDTGAIAGCVAGSELQVDVVSSALPNGAATETTLQTLATEATVALLATEATVATLGTEATLGAIKTSVELLDDAVGTDGASAPAKALVVAGVTAGGTQQTVEVNASGHVHVADGGGSLTVDASSWPLPTGAATESKQDSANSLLTTIDADTSALAGCVGGSELQVDIVSSALPSGAATESTLSALNGKVTVCNTGAVVVSSSALPSGAATESTLSSLNGKVTACDTGAVVVSSSALPSGAATETTLSSLNGKVTACNTGAVVISSSALPSGAATESTLSTLNGKVTACNTGAVTISTALPAGTATIGKVDVNTLSVVDLLDAGILDTSSTNIAGSASSPTQVVASLAADVKKLQILDTTGAFIGVYTGGSGSEVLQLVIGPGSDQTIEHSISASARISLKRLDSTTAVSSGIVAINFIG